MSDDLVERLREAAGEVDIELVNTAADEIERLQARTLELADSMDGTIRVSVDALQRAAAAEAEVVKLRGALAFYANGWEGHAGDSGPGGNYPADPDCWPGEALQEDCGQRARQALTETKDSGRIAG